MKLHIGSGEKHLSGYIHIDIIDRAHIDYVADASNLQFLEDECVSEIYACHVIEHFKRNEIDAVFSEWGRVMCSGGTLRIAAPDFEAIATEYQKNQNLDAVLGLLYGGQDYEHNFHFQVYDFNRLRCILEKAGFKDVQRYDWRTFLPEDYDDFSRAYLPHMDFANGRLMSLNIIAMKG